jgi:hypothetical protein
MTTPRVQPYRQLIERLLSGAISESAFEAQYLETFKNEPAGLPEPLFLVLDGLFADVDAFCADPALRGEGDLDEDQLRERARQALDALAKLGP